MQKSEIENVANSESIKYKTILGNKTPSGKLLPSLIKDALSLTCDVIREDHSYYLLHLITVFLNRADNYRCMNVETFLCELHYLVFHKVNTFLQKIVVIF